MSQSVKFFKTKLHYAVWLLMLLLSYFIYEDYGIAWDEPEQREIGLTTYNYLNDNGVDLQTYRNRSYGIVIELPLIYIEKALHLNNPSEIFKIRHLVLHLLFLIGVFIFYKLNYLLFGKRVLAFLAMLLLYFTPAVFGHSFINSKDIPLMVFFIFGLYALLLFVIKPTKKNVFILAAIIGLTMGIRIIGLLMFGISTLFFIQLFINKKYHRQIVVSRFLLFVFISFLVFYGVSPSMWLHPFSYVKDTFLRMSHFPWNYQTLYLGKMVYARDLPWHYVFGWIFLTLPLLHLFFYLAGLYSTYYFAIKNPIKFLKSIRLFFIAIAADIPILTVLLLIINGSTLYDAWRHVFFFIPFHAFNSSFWIKKNP